MTSFSAQQVIIFHRPCHFVRCWISDWELASLATLCEPCIAQLPITKALYDPYTILLEGVLTLAHVAGAVTRAGSCRLQRSRDVGEHMYRGQRASDWVAVKELSEALPFWLSKRGIKVSSGTV